jgi:hypothetical protein
MNVLDKSFLNSNYEILSRIREKSYFFLVIITFTTPNATSNIPNPAVL